MSGLESMRQRLHVAGGDIDGRNNKSKLKSMLSALKDSYQAEWITLADENGEYNRKARCLINPSRLTEEFDKKVLSIEHDYHVKEGDTFFWDRTGYYWVINLQQHTEEAYFRGIITRCDYEVEIDGEKFWVYLRGPVETSTVWKQKHNITWNELNLSLLMHIPKTPKTLEYFSRHQVIKFDGHNWIVEATDKYSEPGIIQVYFKEYYDNPIEDDMIIPEVKVFEPAEAYISGPQFIKPFDTSIVYSIKNADNGKFVVNSNKVKIVESNKDSLTIDVLTGKYAKFDILYQREGEDDIVLNVTIESI